MKHLILVLATVLVVGTLAGAVQQQCYAYGCDCNAVLLYDVLHNDTVHGAGASSVRTLGATEDCMVKLPPAPMHVDEVIPPLIGVLPRGPVGPQMDMRDSGYSRTFTSDGDRPPLQLPYGASREEWLAFKLGEATGALSADAPVYRVFAGPRYSLYTGVGDEVKVRIRVAQEVSEVRVYPEVPWLTWDLNASYPHHQVLTVTAKRVPLDWMYDVHSAYRDGVPKEYLDTPTSDRLFPGLAFSEKYRTAEHHAFALHDRQKVRSAGSLHPLGGSMASPYSMVPVTVQVVNRFGSAQTGFFLQLAENINTEVLLDSAKELWASQLRKDNLQVSGRTLHFTELSPPTLAQDTHEVRMAMCCAPVNPAHYPSEDMCGMDCVQQEALAGQLGPQAQAEAVFDQQRLMDNRLDSPTVYSWMSDELTAHDGSFSQTLAGAQVWGKSAGPEDSGQRLSGRVCRLVALPVNYIRWADGDWGGASGPSIVNPTLPFPCHTHPAAFQTATLMVKDVELVSESDARSPGWSGGPLAGPVGRLVSQGNNADSVGAGAGLVPTGLRGLRFVVNQQARSAAGYPLVFKAAELRARSAVPVGELGVSLVYSGTHQVVQTLMLQWKVFDELERTGQEGSGNARRVPAVFAAGGDPVFHIHQAPISMGDVQNFTVDNLRPGQVAELWVHMAVHSEAMLFVDAHCQGETLELLFRSADGGWSRRSNHSLWFCPETEAVFSDPAHLTTLVDARERVRATTLRTVLRNDGTRTAYIKQLATHNVLLTSDAYPGDAVSQPFFVKSEAEFSAEIIGRRMIKDYQEVYELPAGGELPVLVHMATDILTTPARNATLGDQLGRVQALLLAECLASETGGESIFCAEVRVTAGVVGHNGNYSEPLWPVVPVQVALLTGNEGQPFITADDRFLVTAVDAQTGKVAHVLRVNTTSTRNMQAGWAKLGPTEDPSPVVLTTERVPPLNVLRFALPLGAYQLQIHPFHRHLMGQQVSLDLTSSTPLVPHQLTAFLFTRTVEYHYEVSSRYATKTRANPKDRRDQVLHTINRRRGGAVEGLGPVETGTAVDSFPGSQATRGSGGALRSARSLRMQSSPIVFPCVNLTCMETERGQRILEGRDPATAGLAAPIIVVSPALVDLEALNVPGPDDLGAAPPSWEGSRHCANARFAGVLDFNVSNLGGAPGRQVSLAMPARIGSFLLELAPRSWASSQLQRSPDAAGGALWDDSGSERFWEAGTELTPSALHERQQAEAEAGVWSGGNGPAAASLGTLPVGQWTTVRYWVYQVFAVSEHVSPGGMEGLCTPYSPEVGVDSRDTCSPDGGSERAPGTDKGVPSPCEQSAGLLHRHRPDLNWGNPSSNAAPITPTHTHYTPLPILHPRCHRQTGSLRASLTQYLRGVKAGQARLPGMGLTYGGVDGVERQLKLRSRRQDVSRRWQDAQMSADAPSLKSFASQKWVAGDGVVVNRLPAQAGVSGAGVHFVSLPFIDQVNRVGFSAARHSECSVCVRMVETAMQQCGHYIDELVFRQLGLGSRSALKEGAPGSQATRGFQSFVDAWLRGALTERELELVRSQLPAVVNSEPLEVMGRVFRNGTRWAIKEDPADMIERLFAAPQTVGNSTEGLVFLMDLAEELVSLGGVSQVQADPASGGSGGGVGVLRILMGFGECAKKAMATLGTPALCVKEPEVSGVFSTHWEVLQRQRQRTLLVHNDAFLDSVPRQGEAVRLLNNLAAQSQELQGLFDAFLGPGALTPWLGGVTLQDLAKTPSLIPRMAQPGAEAWVELQTPWRVYQVGATPSKASLLAGSQFFQLLKAAMATNSPLGGFLSAGEWQGIVASLALPGLPVDSYGGLATPDRDALATQAIYQAEVFLQRVNQTLELMEFKNIFDGSCKVDSFNGVGPAALYSYNCSRLLSIDGLGTQVSLLTKFSGIKPTLGGGLDYSALADMPPVTQPDPVDSGFRAIYQANDALQNPTAEWRQCPRVGLSLPTQSPWSPNHATSMASSTEPAGTHGGASFTRTHMLQSSDADLGQLPLGYGPGGVGGVGGRADGLHRQGDVWRVSPVDRAARWPHGAVWNSGSRVRFAKAVYSYRAEPGADPSPISLDATVSTATEDVCTVGFCDSFDPLNGQSATEVADHRAVLASPVTVGDSGAVIDLDLARAFAEYQRVQPVEEGTGKGGWYTSTQDTLPVDLMVDGQLIAESGFRMRGASGPTAVFELYVLPDDCESLEYDAEHEQLGTALFSEQHTVSQLDEHESGESSNQYAGDFPLRSKVLATWGLPLHWLEEAVNRTLPLNRSHADHFFRAGEVRVALGGYLSWQANYDVGTHAEAPTGAYTMRLPTLHMTLRRRARPQLEVWRLVEYEQRSGVLEFPEPDTAGNRTLRQTLIVRNTGATPLYDVAVARSSVGLGGFVVEKFRAVNGLTEMVAGGRLHSMSINGQRVQVLDQQERVIRSAVSHPVLGDMHVGHDFQASRIVEFQLDVTAKYPSWVASPLVYSYTAADGTGPLSMTVQPQEVFVYGQPISVGQTGESDVFFESARVPVDAPVVDLAADWTYPIYLGVRNGTKGGQVVDAAGHVTLCNFGASASGVDHTITDVQAVALAGGLAEVRLTMVLDFETVDKFDKGDCHFARIYDPLTGYQQVTDLVDLLELMPDRELVAQHFALAEVDDRTLGYSLKVGGHVRRAQDYSGAQFVPAEDEWDVLFPYGSNGTSTKEVVLRYVGPENYVSGLIPDLYPPPLDVTVTFTGDLRALEVKFNQATLQGSTALYGAKMDCDQYVTSTITPEALNPTLRLPSRVAARRAVSTEDNTVSRMRFGEGYYCQWVDSSTILVQLGPDATVQDETNVVVQDVNALVDVADMKTLGRVRQQTLSFFSRSVQVPPGLEDPAVEVNGPSVIGTCYANPPIVAKGSGLVPRGGHFSFDIASISPPDTAMFNSLRDVLFTGDVYYDAATGSLQETSPSSNAAWQALRGSGVLDFSMMPPLVEGSVYTFAVTVDNFLGYESTAVQHQVTKAAISIPSLTLGVPPSIIAGKPFKLKALLDTSMPGVDEFGQEDPDVECPLFESLVFQWSLSGPNGPMTLPDQVKDDQFALQWPSLNPPVLQAGAEYTFSLQVVGSVIGGALFSASQSATVVTQAPDFRAVISRGSRLLNPGQSVLLDVTTTTDPLQQSIVGVRWWCGRIDEVNPSDYLAVATQLRGANLRSIQDLMKIATPSGQPILVETLPAACYLGGVNGDDSAIVELNADSGYTVAYDADAQRYSKTFPLIAHAPALPSGTRHLFAVEVTLADGRTDVDAALISVQVDNGGESAEGPSVESLEYVELAIKHPQEVGSQDRVRLQAFLRLICPELGTLVYDSMGLTGDAVGQRISYHWSLVGDDLQELFPEVDDSSATLVIDGELMEAGRDYTFRLQVEADSVLFPGYSVHAENSVSVRRLSPPASGLEEALRVVPPNGHAMTTYFQATAQGWTGEYGPLLYSFSMATMNDTTGMWGETVDLLVDSDSPSARFFLPPGHVRVTVTVRDQKGETAQAAFEVDVEDPFDNIEPSAAQAAVLSRRATSALLNHYVTGLCKLYRKSRRLLSTLSVLQDPSAQLAAAAVLSDTLLGYEFYDYEFDACDFYVNSTEQLDVLASISEPSHMVDLTDEPLFALLYAELVQLAVDAAERVDVIGAPQASELLQKLLSPSARFDRGLRLVWETLEEQWTAESYSLLTIAAKERLESLSQLLLSADGSDAIVTQAAKSAALSMFDTLAATVAPNQFADNATFCAQVTLVRTLVSDLLDVMMVGYVPGEWPVRRGQEQGGFSSFRSRLFSDRDNTASLGYGSWHLPEQAISGVLQDTSALGNGSGVDLEEAFGTRRDFDVRLMGFTDPAYGACFGAGPEDEATLVSGVVDVDFVLNNAKVAVAGLEGDALVRFDLKYDPSALPAGHVPVCAFYDPVNNTWLEDGCATVAMFPTYITCECAHFTAFGAVARAGAQSSSSERTMYTVFGVLFSLLLLAFVVQTFRVLCLRHMTYKVSHYGSSIRGSENSAASRSGRSNARLNAQPNCCTVCWLGNRSTVCDLMMNEFVLAIVGISVTVAICFLQAVPDDSDAPSISDLSPVAVALLFCIPLQVQFIMYTLLVFTWLRAYHFSMRKASGKQGVVRGLFIAVNVIIGVLLVVLMIMFAVTGEGGPDDKDFDDRKKLAQVGSAVIAVFLLAASVLSFFYGIMIFRLLTSVRGVKQAQRGSRMLRFSSMLAVALFAQAVCWVVQLVDFDSAYDDSHLPLYGCYYVFQLAGFLLILFLFYQGVSKTHADYSEAKNSSRGGSSNASGSQSGSRKPRRARGVMPAATAASSGPVVQTEEKQTAKPRRGSAFFHQAEESSDYSDDASEDSAVVGEASAQRGVVDSDEEMAGAFGVESSVSQQPAAVEMKDLGGAGEQADAPSEQLAEVSARAASEDFSSSTEEDGVGQAYELSRGPVSQSVSAALEPSVVQVSVLEEEGAFEENYDDYEGTASDSSDV